MLERGHALIVVAEGAGQHLFDDQSVEQDASGNRRFQDIGPYLKTKIITHFEEIGQPIDLKYIDPSYIVRSAPANSEDALLCDVLARRAVDAAMSGRTNLIIAPMNSSFVHVPIPMAIAGKRCVDIGGWYWNAVISSTGQPSQFRPPIS